jgi:chaperonin GroES
MKIATAATRSIKLAWVPGGLEGPPGARKSGELDGSRPSQEVRTLATATAAKTKLRPLMDRVVVKPTAREEMTKSGIVLPDTAKEKPQEGTILAIGPGGFDAEGKRTPMDVKAGQKVLYAKYAGTEFKIDEEELLIVSQKDILAVVED